MFRSFVESSRRLRKDQTRHELTLWTILRARRFQGVKFRRQHEIGPYIVDFCCPEKKFVVELDGGGHGEPVQEKKDRARDEYLTKQGYRVMRFWNSDLDQNLEGVLESILAEITSPSP